MMDTFNRILHNPRFKSQEKTLEIDVELKPFSWFICIGLAMLVYLPMFLFSLF